MKILWVTGVIVGDMCEKLGISHPASGSWIEALLEKYIELQHDEIVIISSYRLKKTEYLKKGNISYYVLPHGADGINKNEKGKNEIKQIIEKEKPDIINIWGTEYVMGLHVVECAKNIPTIIYIQGVVKSIARYYFAGMNKKELRRAISFRDIVKRDWIARQKIKFSKKSEVEKELIKKVDGIISETRWCNSIYKAIKPEINIYKCALSIREVFEKYEWNIEKVEKHAIMTTAPGYPLKGLHILLKALRLVANRYPDVVLRVPGYVPQASTIMEIIRQSGYSRYILSLIEELDLEKNIEFTGVLSAENMAKNMEKSNLFILPSAIENHSSTLKEAMLVGVPSIASYVGGIPEYVIEGYNGMLYRFEDYELLADKIMELFENEEKAIYLSQNARKSMLELHSGDSIYDTMKEIYDKLKNGKK